MADLSIPFGAILFDGGELGAGWACDSAGHSFRVQSISALDNNHVWISNLTFDQIAGNGLSRHARIKGMDFLGRPLPEIFRQYGLLNPLSSPNERELEGLPNGKEMAIHLSGIANRVGAFLNSVFNIDIDESTQSWSISSMVGEIYSCKPFLDQHLETALNNASQPWVRVAQRHNKNDAVVRLYVSGRQHLKRITHETFLPNDDAKWVRKTGDKALEAARGHPCSIARITISGMNDVWSNVLNFGTNTARGRKLWVTSTDFIFLEGSIDKDDKHSRIDVIESWEPDSFFRLSDLFTGDGHQALFDSKGGEFSLAFSLACTSLWVGLTQPKKPHLSFKTKNKKIIKPANVYAPFIRSADRMILLENVLLFKAQGVRVLGYGKGAIDVVNDGFSADDWFTLSKLSTKSNCDCPVLLPEQRGEMGLLKAVDGTDEFDILRSIRLTAGSDVVIDADIKASNSILKKSN